MNEKKNLQILDQFWLRIIAIITMTFSHIGTFIGLYSSDIGGAAPDIARIFYIIGRFAFPLFVFMMVEGMFYSHSRGKYLLRIALLYLLVTVAEIIFVYAILRQPDFANTTYPGPSPITDLLLIALMLFFLYRPKAQKLFALLPIGIEILSYVLVIIETRDASTIYWFPLMFRPAYGIYGMFLALGFYMVRPISNLITSNYCKKLELDFDTFKQEPEYQKVLNIGSVTALFVVTLIFWAISYITYDPYSMPLQTYCLLSIPLYYLYSGKRGYDSKTFRIISYAYFPVHLGILILVFFVSFGHI